MWNPLGNIAEFFQDIASNLGRFFSNIGAFIVDIPSNLWGFLVKQGAYLWDHIVIPIFDFICSKLAGFFYWLWDIVWIEWGFNKYVILIGIIAAFIWLTEPINIVMKYIFKIIFTPIKICFKTVNIVNKWCHKYLNYIKEIDNEDY